MADMMADDGMSPAPRAGGADPARLGPDVAKLFGGDGAAQAPPEGPSYDDDKKLLKFFDECKQEAYEDRWVYERGWWRNLLYALGRQWIYYDARRGQWQDKRLAKWMPRPVTNVTAETVSAIRSVFTGVQLGVVARPSGYNPGDLTTAELADQLHPLVHREHDMDRTIREQDFWLAVGANAFLHVWWDKGSETNGQIVVPFERCTQCGQLHPPEQLMGPSPRCPDCGGQGFEKADPSEGKTYRVGKG